MINYISNMKKYLYLSALLFICLLMLAGCEKMSQDGLRGRWKPVYASISYEDAVSRYSCDGRIDEHGNILMLRVGIEHPDVKYEEPILITGIRFFKKNGEDVFTTFFLDSPKEDIGKPLLYRIENGKLYREWPMGALINCDPDVLNEGSGQFDKGSPISFLPDGQVKIGDITYQRF